MRRIQKLAIKKIFFHFHETLWKWLSYEAFIFTKFHKDWTKIVDLSLMANFWMCPFFCSDFTSKYKVVMKFENDKFESDPVSSDASWKALCLPSVAVWEGHCTATFKRRRKVSEEPFDRSDWVSRWESQHICCWCMLWRCQSDGTSNLICTAPPKHLFLCTKYTSLSDT